MPVYDHVSVPISLNLYSKILARYPDRPHAVIEDVLASFLERTEPTRESGRETRNRKRGDAGRGITWEKLFLPDKARLRTKHHGAYKYLDVRGDELVHEGTVYSSVSRATNVMRGNTQNNAWRVLEILMPGAEKWVSAEALRLTGTY